MRKLCLAAIGCALLLAAPLAAKEPATMYNMTDKLTGAASLPAPGNPTNRTPPTSGQRLSIPPEAAEKNDLSFLEGCWVNTTTVYEQSEKRIVTIREYCFNADGSGRRTIKEQNGSRTCSGSFTSYFDANKVLHVKSQAATCRGGSGNYLPDNLRCSGTGDKTRCTGFGSDPGSGRNWRWEADFRRK